MLPKPTREKPYVMIGEAIAGAYAHGASFFGDEMCWGTSLSTYISLEEIAKRPDVAEGAIVIDKREVSDPFMMVYRSPMDGLDLPPRTIRPCLGDSMNFETVEAAIDSGLCSPLSKVSIDIYAEIWRRNGAKIGRVVGGEIVYEDAPCPQ